MFLNKEFCADGIGLRVEAWITFFNKQNLVHKAFELWAAFALAWFSDGPRSLALTPPLDGPRSLALTPPPRGGSESEWPRTVWESGYICVGSETDFHLGDMSSRGPPKGVYQSLSSYVQQCVGDGVGQYSRHNPYHTDHMKINRPRTVD